MTPASLPRSHTISTSMESYSDAHLIKLLGIVLECPVLILDAVSVARGNFDAHYYAGTGGICQEVLKTDLNLPFSSFFSCQSPEQTLIAFSDTWAPAPYCDEFKKHGMEKLKVDNHPITHWHAVLARRLGEDNAAEIYYGQFAQDDSSLIEDVLLRLMKTQQAKPAAAIAVAGEGGGGGEGMATSEILNNVSGLDGLQMAEIRNFPWPRSADDINIIMNAKFPYSLLLAAGVKGVENRSGRDLNDQCIAGAHSLARELLDQATLSQAASSSGPTGWCCMITSKNGTFDTPSNYKVWHPRRWNAFQGWDEEKLPKNVVDTIAGAMAASGQDALIPWWTTQAEQPIPQGKCVGLVRWAPGNAIDAFKEATMSNSPWFIAGNHALITDAAVLFRTPVDFPLRGIPGGSHSRRPEHKLDPNRSDIC